MQALAVVWHVGLAVVAYGFSGSMAWEKLFDSQRSQYSHWEFLRAVLCPFSILLPSLKTS